MSHHLAATFFTPSSLTTSANLKNDPIPSTNVLSNHIHHTPLSILTVCFSSLFLCICIASPAWMITMDDNTNDRTFKQNCANSGASLRNASWMRLPGRKCAFRENKANIPTTEVNTAICINPFGGVYRFTVISDFFKPAIASMSIATIRERISDQAVIGDWNGMVYSVPYEEQIVSEDKVTEEM